MSNHNTNCITPHSQQSKPTQNSSKKKVTSGKSGTIATTNKGIISSESWFVGKQNNHTVLVAEPATFEPLINGETAFEELHHAIENATKSVEIVCWAFQPSMYFKRARQEKNLPIGELLMKQFIEKNVDVKILCWQTSPLASEKFLEDNTPGRSTLLFLHEYLAYGYFIDFMLEPNTIYQHFEKLEKEKFLEPEIAMHKIGSAERHKFYRSSRSHSVEQRRFDWAWYDAVEGYNTITNEAEFHQKMAQFQKWHDMLHGAAFGAMGEVLKLKKTIGTGISEFKEYFETHILPDWIKEYRDTWRNIRFNTKEEIHFRLMQHVHYSFQKIYEIHRDGAIGKTIATQLGEFVPKVPDSPIQKKIENVDDLRRATFHILFAEAKKSIIGTNPIHPVDRTQGSIIGLANKLESNGISNEKIDTDKIQNIMDLFFDFDVLRDYVNCMNYHFLLRNAKYTLQFMHLRNKADYQLSKQKVSFLTREINPAIFQEDFPFKDEGLSQLTKDVLRFTPTHHQKSVMIDYTDPKLAVGFVMGHNMLDRYWDTNQHHPLSDEFKTYTTQRKGPGEVESIDQLQNIANEQMRGRHPSAAEFFGTPRQDISCKLTGRVLYDIDANFVQGWNKALEDNGYYRNRIDAIQPAERMKRSQFQPRNEQENSNSDTEKTSSESNVPELVTIKSDVSSNTTAGSCQPKNAQSLYAQILRTQPEYKEENIHTLYSQNFKKALSYIYFENQYFRFPPFAETLRDGLDERKAFAKRHGIDTSAMQPLCVFVVTNSSAEGLGPGVVNTDRMLKALGRRDVMPTVARERILEQAGYGNRIQRMLPNIPENSIWRKILPDFILPPPPLKPVQGKEESEASKNRALAEHIKNVHDTDELRKILKEDLEKKGIRVHICTLVAQDWEEIYIHSKLCLINDTFTTLGSANINTRSMQIDSELNVAIESQPATHKMRQDIWKWHTDGSEEMNPSAQLVSPVVANDIFDTWKDMMKINKDMKEKKQLRIMSLMEFDLTDKNQVPTVDWD